VRTPRGARAITPSAAHADPRRYAARGNHPQRACSAPKPARPAQQATPSTCNLAIVIAARCPPHRPRSPASHPRARRPRHRRRGRNPVSETRSIARAARRIAASRRPARVFRGDRALAPEAPRSESRLHVHRRTRRPPLVDLTNRVEPWSASSATSRPGRTGAVPPAQLEAALTKLAATTSSASRLSRAVRSSAARIRVCGAAQPPIRPRRDPCQPPRAHAPHVGRHAARTAGSAPTARAAAIRSQYNRRYRLYTAGSTPRGTALRPTLGQPSGTRALPTPLLQGAPSPRRPAAHAAPPRCS
jgi:hypothetical protein